MTESLNATQSRVLYALWLWAEEHGRERFIRPVGSQRRTLAILAARGYIETLEKPGSPTLARITDAGRAYMDA